MNKKFNFTQARIRDLPTPEKGRVDYSDTQTDKLICRVSHTGNKSFLVTKRVDGKLMNITIGKFQAWSLATAREKAMSIIAELNSGINPMEAKRKKIKQMALLAEVLERYFDGRDLKPLTVKDYRYKLKLGFSDWLKKPINSITEDMVLKRQKMISQEKGNTTANTTMRVLRLTFNYAIAVGITDSNPVSILSKVRLWHKNKRKDQIIPSAQLKAWHESVETLPNQKAKAYLLLALYMGFRREELLKIEWSHVDISAKTIKVYDSKNRTDLIQPIPEHMMPYINALKINTGFSKWVFPGILPGKHMTVPIRPIKSVIQSSGVDFSSNDCRRTFCTIAEAVNLPMSMIKRLMNHVTTNDVTGGYIITEEETLRLAINKVADYIQSKVTQQDNVIQLHANK